MQKTVTIQQKKYGSWGWIDERELYQRVTDRRVRPLVIDVVDDLRDFTIALATYPMMVIVTVTAPATARPGETIGVSVSWRNDGGDGTYWRRAYDIDTNEEVLPRGEIPIIAGRTGSSVFYPIMPPGRDLRIRFEIGHIED